MEILECQTEIKRLMTNIQQWNDEEIGPRKSAIDERMAVIKQLRSEKSKLEQEAQQLRRTADSACVRLGKPSIYSINTDISTRT